jgi:hypothetical protein
MSIGTEAMISLARLSVGDPLWRSSKTRTLPLFAIQENIFPSLTELDVTVDDSAIAVGLLEVLRCPLLSLSITVFDDIITSFYAQLALFQKMFSLLHQYHCSSLKALSINFLPVSKARRDQAVIDTLALLSSFSSLANLTLLTPFSQHLDDAWFAQAVGSWSRLEYISIADSGPPLGPPNFSLKGIIPMIKQCP